MLAWRVTCLPRNNLYVFHQNNSEKARFCSRWQRLEFATRGRNTQGRVEKMTECSTAHLLQSLHWLKEYANGRRSKSAPPASGTVGPSCREQRKRGCGSLAATSLGSGSCHEGHKKVSSEVFQGSSGVVRQTQAERCG